VSDTVGNDARFARPGACQDEDRAFGCKYGVALALVHIVE
jgi:hypothetical protein